MDKLNCSECDQYFSRRDVMLRHRRHKHVGVGHAYPQSSQAYQPPPPPPKSSEAYPQSSQAYPPLPPPPPKSSEAYPQSSQAYPPPPPPPPPKSSKAYPPPPPQGGHDYVSPSQNNAHAAPILFHPFTMIVSGPTACGKTSLVKILLLHNITSIQPSIQRIVWLYRRWQPAYVEIRNMVSPKVEFIQGIPRYLEDDEYFDPNVNNLLILDDLMSVAGKDKRINDLFTEGSHHRNLSVIAINQNLYASKDPTQRRNCHYLVLFNNPVDKQAVMTLARQMYPGNTDVFMNAFNKSTKYPYGYLLVDLKPFTKEQDRLKWDTPLKENGLNQKKWTNQKQDSRVQPIKAEIKHNIFHSCVGTQTDRIEVDCPNLQNEMTEKMNSCDDCGILFDTPHDVQRHVKKGMCSETYEPLTKKRKVEGSENEYEPEDNDGFINLWIKAQENGNDKFEQLKDRYLADGESEEEASEFAESQIQSYNEREFIRLYKQLLERFIVPLSHNGVHREIVKKIEELISKGASVSNASSKVMRKNMDKFEALFEMENTEMSDEENETDSESE